MEPKFQSSFIPKGPLATTGIVSRTSSQSDRSVLGTLAVLVFVLSILTSAGAFGYEWYLRKDISKMSQDLITAESALDKETINKISALDGRIVSTKSLLNSHIVLSPLFTFIEDSTLKTVRYTQFRYSSSPSGLKLSMQGEARGYSTLALQAQIFNSSKYMKDVVFGDLSLDEKGNVNFSLKANLDPSITAFNRGESAPQAVVEDPVTANVVAQ